MKRHVKLIVLVSLVASQFCFCSKEEEHSQVRFSIQNFSSFDIDSLIIHSSSYITYSIYDRIVVFKNLTSGLETEKVLFQDVESTLHFEAYILGKSIEGHWHYPNSPIDPSGPIYIPNGTYNFGIIECDTTTGRMVVGLL